MYAEYVTVESSNCWRWCYGGKYQKRRAMQKVGWWHQRLVQRFSRHMTSMVLNGTFTNYTC